MKKIKLLYNVAAGQNEFKYFLDAIVEKFSENNYEVSLFRIDKGCDLEGYLLKSKDADGIVVAGGDGTINKVVNVMMKNRIMVPLGVIPAGTSNDFARHINMPPAFIKSIEKIIKGNIEPIDVGLANNHYFINVCSAGLCTNASQKTDKKLKKIFGKIAYFFTGIIEFIKFKPFEARIETENDVYEGKVVLFLIFNGSTVGGIDLFTKNPSIQDGLLDCIIVKDCRPRKFNKMLAKFLAGNLDDENIMYLKEKWIKITKLSGKCDAPDVDGDPGPEFPLEVKCIKNGLNMFL
ncbi:MAG: YegS/Rv2252/BmrU family lipid kinase [Clostridia bacterium]|nr:YegS/Rv2252/BmrU family lipid kinase [Clostridia bacterium]MDD4375624.1 YegS/Rv2252/BmrU family lipid kinase [Clostridia bacterium]